MPFPVSGERNARAERLWSVYALERGTDQTTPAVSFGIAAVGIAFIATTLGFLQSRSAASPVPFVILAILPIVPTGLYTSLIIQNRTTQIRNYYLNTLEHALRILDYEDDDGVPPAEKERLPVPAFRLWSVNTLMTNELRLKTAGAALLHPYSQSAMMIGLYDVYILAVYPQRLNWYHLAFLTFYLLLLIGNVAQLIYGKNYLFGSPASRFSSDVTNKDFHPAAGSAGKEVHSFEAAGESREG